MAISEKTDIAINKVHSNGRVQIPAEVREKLGIEDGDKIKWCLHKSGFIFIMRYEKAKIGVKYEEE